MVIELENGNGDGYNKEHFIIGKIVNEEEIFRSEDSTKIVTKVEVNEDFPFIEAYCYENWNQLIDLSISLKIKDKTYPLLSTCYQTDIHLEDKEIDYIIDDVSHKRDIIDTLNIPQDENTLDALRYIFSTDLKLETSKEDIFKELKKVYDSSPEFAEDFINEAMFPSKNNETIIDLFEVLIKEFDIPEDTFLYVENNKVFAEYTYDMFFKGKKDEEPIFLLKIDNENLWNLDELNMKGVEKIHKLQKMEEKYFQNLECRNKGLEL